MISFLRQRTLLTSETVQTQATYRLMLSNPSLPILAQPSYIRRALNAGKHVLSEKPIAQDLSTAQDLLTWYRTSIASDSSTQQHATWSVAENFRFQTSLLHASAQIKDLGRILNFSVKMYTFVKPGSKYFGKTLSILWRPWVRRD